MKITRVLNWRPDLPDHRDFKYSLHHATEATAKLPASVNLKAHCPPVVDQGQIGSCTGNAIAGMMGYMQLREIRYKLDPSGAPEMFDTKTFMPFSRLFIYYNEREMEGTTNEDAGAMIRDGIKSISSTGVCSEKTWSYTPSHLYKMPPVAAYKEASQHVVKTYSRINGLTEMKACLAAGYPFVFGFTVYDNFMTEEMARTGKLTMPGPNDSVQGGHAVMAVGYDDAHKRFTIRNSWGTSWGLNGYFHMPYEYISNDDLASDFWTIRK